MKTVFLLRGIPGGGKSTVAEILTHHIQGGSEIVSADHYMINELTGEYQFDREKLSWAHASCRNAYREALKNGVTRVIVDNTNIKRSDFMRDYRREAIEAGYRFIELTIGDFNVEEATKRNTHNVPIETIQRMRDEFQLMKVK